MSLVLDAPLVVESAPETRDIFGLSIAATVSPAVADAVIETVERGGHARYAFVNAHAANTAWENPRFHAALSTFHILPDGVGIDVGARVLHGRAFPENVNGTDFLPHLFATCRRPLSVGLLGARPEVVEAARANFQARYPAHDFRTVHHGYFDEAERDRILGGLARDPVDILLVAFGNPVQEIFIADHIDARHARVAFGIGALFDFTSGRMARAPLFMREHRLEWLFRLYLEPRRMWRRYVVGNPVFVTRLLCERWGRGLPDHVRRAIDGSG